MEIELSICIVSYNVSAYLNNCIQSIKENVRDVRYEIIIVDNDSKDDSVNIIKREYPEINLIENIKNTGYAPAMNIAIKNAVGKYILILSPDTIIKGNAIKRMLNYMKNNTNVGIIGPKTYNGDGEIVTSCHSENPWVFPVGEFWGLANLARGNKYFKAIISKIFKVKTGVTNDYTVTQEVNVLDGGCLLSSKKVLSEIGFIDEAISIGPDDYDTCKRVKLKGYKVVFLSEAEIIHFVCTSKNKFKSFVVKVHYPAFFYFFRKWNNIFSSFLFLIFYSTNLMLRSIYYLFKKDIDMALAYFAAVQKSSDIYFNFSKYNSGSKKLIN